MMISSKMAISSKSALGLTLLAALGLAAARPAAAQTITVGTPDTFGGSRFPFGFDTTYSPANYGAGGEYQELYSSTDFGGAGSPFTIHNIAFASTTGSTPGTATFNLTLRLSTTTATTGSLSSTFAANEGGNQAVVFSGPLTANIQANGTFDLVFPTTPFVYTPSQGNLLLDVVLNQTTQAASPLYFFSDNSFSGSTARVFQAGGTGGGSTFGSALYTQFNAPAPAVPEASTTASLGLLLMLGFGGVVLVKRRRVA